MLNPITHGPWPHSQWYQNMGIVSLDQWPSAKMETPFCESAFGFRSILSPFGHELVIYPRGYEQAGLSNRIDSPPSPKPTHPCHQIPPLSLQPCPSPPQNKLHHPHSPNPWEPHVCEPPNPPPPTPPHQHPPQPPPTPPTHPPSPQTPPTPPQGQNQPQKKAITNR